jgi:hypothetical protein
MTQTVAASDIKTFNITGGAEIFGGKKTKRTTRKNQQMGGSDADIPKGVSPNIMLIRGNDPASVATTAAPANPSGWLNSPIPAPPRIMPAPSSQPVSQQQQSGGASTDKHIRVELKKHTTPKRVHLNPKKSDAPKVLKKDKTRKNRKVTVGVSSLHRRMTHAKKLRDRVKDMPIDKLKEELIKSKLIKPTSKAPESVLRQIASDAEVVAKKAL